MLGTLEKILLLLCLTLNLHCDSGQVPQNRGSSSASGERSADRTRSKASGDNNAGGVELPQGGTRINFDEDGYNSGDHYGSSAACVTQRGACGRGDFRRYDFCNLSGGNSHLTDEELGTISVLASAANISPHCAGGDLAVIKYLVELTDLDLSSQQIEDSSPLQDLRSLRRLIIHTNRIEQVSFVGLMHNLRELNISNNRLTSLTGFNDATGITTLDVRGNNLDTLQGVELLRGLTTFHYDAGIPWGIGFSDRPVAFRE